MNTVIVYSRDLANLITLADLAWNLLINCLLFYAGMRYERRRSGKIEYHDDHGPNWDRKEPEL
ncbi:hypothetical protein [Pseudoduganella sp. R-34]|uniref:hypothetical protein n=1 Tax=Pseudoduganella sp. R-34 TaxID=3404062 RepID=UPI003CEA0BBE